MHTCTELAAIDEHDHPNPVARVTLHVCVCANGVGEKRLHNTRRATAVTARRRTAHRATFMNPLVVPSFMVSPETIDSAMRKGSYSRTSAVTLPTRTVLDTVYVGFSSLLTLSLPPRGEGQ